MYVCGMTSQISPASRAVSAWYRGSARKLARSRAARRSANQKPALWRSRACLRPGFPSPAISLMAIKKKARRWTAAPLVPAVPVTSCRPSPPWPASRPSRASPARHQRRRHPGSPAAASAAGTCDAGTASATAAASSSSVGTAFGSDADATTGSSPRWRTGVTPFGKASSFTWIECPTVIFERSTSMNSGRSAGRHEISMSFITWLITAAASFTAGDSSAFRKCSGTFMWIFLSACTRWKSMCCTCAFHGMHVDRAQQHLLLLAVEAERDDRRVERLAPRLQVELVVVELDRERRLGAAVEDAGHLARVAQTAARTRSLRGALGSAEFDLHDALQSLWPGPRPGTAR